MLHENLVRNDQIDGPSNRRFGLTIAAACCIAAVIRSLTGHVQWEWWLGGGLVIGGLSIVWPEALAPLNRLWLRLGLALQRIVSPIVMTVLFAIAIVPMGVLLRLSGKDLLRLRPNRDAASYWIAKQQSALPSDTMRNQF